MRMRQGCAATPPAASREDGISAPALAPYFAASRQAMEALKILPDRG
jgi:hypothetical protein